MQAAQISMPALPGKKSMTFKFSDGTKLVSTTVCEMPTTTTHPTAFSLLIYYTIYGMYLNILR